MELIVQNYQFKYQNYSMISFKYKSTTKRVKIKTNQKLDERMSNWLQKVFNFKNQIIGFKSTENKYYDVETFYSVIEKFFGAQVEIVEATDQMEISFTSDNLNSSSFIRPSQPNTSELNQKDVSSDDRTIFCYTAQEFLIVPDRKSFQKKLQDVKEINILFDVNQCFKKELVDSYSQIMSCSAIKTHLFMYINNSTPKKSCLTIYFGKLNVITIPLTIKYKAILRDILTKAKKSSYFALNFDKENRILKPQEDEAPSFTTYHLQERLNQEACVEYLSKMHKDKLLRNYEYYKLSEKLEENFTEFYRLFCDGVMDNDYESFKNQILHKVQNNLEIILSNVDEMDLSRPISRQEQRKQNLKKSVPQIQIVKVQNYFEILDQLKKFIDPQFIGEIKQQLLDEDEQVCGYFSKYLAREINQQQLAKRLVSFAKSQIQNLRPFSRCVPRSAARTRSVDQVRKSQNNAVLNFLDVQPIKQEDPPMFGSLSIKPVESNFSPIKYMSDIDSNYKLAWERLAQKSSFFASDQYGLLYHYLQTKDDRISNMIQELQWNEEGSLNRLKAFLQERMATIMSENFNELEIMFLDSIKHNPTVNCIYENFRYQSDIHAFLNSLKEEMQKLRPPLERTLHKKSSDSQLLERQSSIRYGIRKYSDEQVQQGGQSSPKESQISLYQKASDLGLYQLEALRRPWLQEFEEMLAFCDFKQKNKEEYLRTAFLEGNSSLFMQVREYLKAKAEGRLDQQELRNNMEVKDYDLKLVIKIAPIFNQLLTAFTDQGRITDKIRKWSVLKLLQVNLTIISAFEVYLSTKDESDLIDTILLIYEMQSKDMQVYQTYLHRIERILKEMSIHDEIGVEIFQFYPKTIEAVSELYYITGDIEDMLDSLEVLYIAHKNHRLIQVASLNFSGINTNPFQYDDGSQLFIRLNRTVQQLITREIPDMKEWTGGKIDKIYQKNRLSIAFGDTIELVQGKLPNRQQFQVIWRKWFDQAGMKEKVKPEPTEENINNTIIMDYLFYRAILVQVYGIESLSLIEHSIPQLNPEKLYKFIEESNNRPSCQLNTKQNMVIEYLMKSNADVLCLQEAGSVSWEEVLVKEFGMVKNHDSIIIFRKSKLGNIRQHQMQIYAKTLDFNNDSAYLFTDRNYLIVSGHLKSNNTNVEQAAQMFESLRQVLQQHPLLKIIIGIDANHLITEHEGFNLVPNSPDVPTSVKKRSFLQAQYKKSGLLVSEVKDHIITNRNINEFRIERVDGVQTMNESLPNDAHPYDHYIVRAIVQ